MPKFCGGCKRLLSTECFSKMARSRDGLHVWCKECNRRVCAEWRHRPENEERIKNRKRTDLRYVISSCLRSALRRQPTVGAATIDDLMRMHAGQDGLCAVSKIPMTWGRGGLLPTSISIDRLDHKNGYTLSNIRLVCYAVNSFRGQMTDEDMVRMAEAIVANAGGGAPSILPLTFVA